MLSGSLIKSSVILLLSLATSHLFSFSSSSLQVSPDLWNIPQNIDFSLKRQKYLEALSDKFSKGSLMITLTGMTGIGKTEIAFQFAQEQYKTYNVVWYMDASKSLKEQYLTLFTRLKPLPNGTPSTELTVQEKIAFVKDWFRKTKLSWLLIFDNASDYESLHSFIPERHNEPGKHILITSQSQLHWGDVIPVEKFERSESLYFLGTFFKQEERQDLNALAEALVDHPFALYCAASHIAVDEGLSVRDYLKTYKERRDDLWAQENQVLTHLEKKRGKKQSSVQAALDLYIHKLQRLNGDAYELLCFLTWMDATKVGRETLDRWSRHFSKNIVLTLLDLKNYHFLRPKRDNQRLVYFVHDFVKAITLSKMTPEQKNLAHEELLSYLRSVLGTSPDAVIAFLEENPDYVEYVKSFLKHVTSEKLDKETMELKIRFLYYFDHYRKDYETAVPLSQRISKNIDRLLDKNSLEIARFYNLYCLTEYCIEDKSIDQCLQTALKSKAILDRLDSQEALEEKVFLLTNSLGSFYHWRGEIDKVYECWQEASHISKDFKSVRNDILLKLEFLLIQLDRGSLEGISETVAAAQQILDASPNLKTPFSDLFWCMIAQWKMLEDRPDEAYKWALKAHEFASKKYPKTHESLARVLVIVADLERELRDPGSALDKIRAAVDIFDADFGRPDKHIRQAYARMVLGSCYHKKAQLDEAQKAYDFAEALYGSILKNFKIDAISDLYYRRALLAIDRKEPSLFNHYLQKHTTLFGLNHRRSVKLLKYLDEKGYKAQWS